MIRIHFYIALFVTIIVYSFLVSCCKCEYVDVENSYQIRVRNYEVQDFINPKIIYSINSNVVDTVYLYVDTMSYYALGFLLKSNQLLNYNYDWQLIANDSLSFDISEFEIHTVNNGCCKGVTHLNSYHLNSIQKNESVVTVE